ncbi:MAG TPA: hypothetical protein VFI02_17285, partial [Armatimonadota bacterium]|nr:hypothetical protein [Armatimonadota bacterium]
DLKSLSILARVEAIEVDRQLEAEGGGVKTVMKQLDDPVVGLEIIKALPSEDRAYMRQVYDAMEADVDTSVEVGCDNRACGIDFSFVLDLGQAFFLNPVEEVTAEALNWL